MDIVIDNIIDLFKKNCNNYDKVRSCTMASNIQSPRTLSMSLSDCNEDYTARVQCESNNMVEDDQVVLSDSLCLEYTTLNSQDNQVSKVSNYTTNIGQQCVECNAPALNNNVVNNDNMFNIQLQYDINQALDLESWNGNFKAILLHESMEHLVLDIKNIKETLGRMQKYVLSKTIESGKANDIKNLEGVGKVVWRFILLFMKLIGIVSSLTIQTLC